MIRLLLVQHAETAWNVEGRYQGHTDVLLNEKGRRQAVLLRNYLAAETVHQAYASDLRRAWDTAAAITQARSLSLHPEPRLRELRFGAWEGLSYAQIQEAHPEALAAWEGDPEQVAPPGGETLANLKARLHSFLDELRHQRSVFCETILLVAHRGSLRLLLCLALGLPSLALRRFRLDAASVTELQLHDGTAVLVRLNDTHHLREVAHAR
jgi:broad specificity phosphatase PhoE